MQDIAQIRGRPIPQKRKHQKKKKIKKKKSRVPARVKRVPARAVVSQPGQSCPSPRSRVPARARATSTPLPQLSGRHHNTG
jgi:hypothetical protein